MKKSQLKEIIKDVLNEFEKKKYPLHDPKSPVFKHLKKKYVELTMTDKNVGTDWKGNIYKIKNGVAKKLK